MKKIQFYINKSFYLTPIGWGEAQVAEIITLLDSIILDFFSLFDSSKISDKEVIVLNSTFKIPPTDYPEIIKLPDLNLIILSTTDRFWSQYSYQFSHELCHHIIDSNFFSANDKFGWFEEALCEMASIYCIKGMSNKWKTNPPYPNWRIYSKSLEGYITAILAKEENNIDTSFQEWFNHNEEILYEDRYNRKENRIIAIKLLSQFENQPELWFSIQYLKYIEVKEETSLEEFFIQWESFVPENLKSQISELQKIFT